LKLLAFWTSFAAFKNQVPLLFFKMLHFAVQDIGVTTTFYGHKMPLNRADSKDSRETRTFAFCHPKYELFKNLFWTRVLPNQMLVSTALFVLFQAKLLYAFY
jgi:hypothetical protein